MADPFSVAGSAAGVISLGLTVCQGLLAYYGPFKSFHGQIDEVACRIAALDSMLKVLKTMLINARLLSASPTAPSTAVAFDSILCCQEGLNRLKKTLEKCNNTRLADNLIASKIQINRMLYPFKRETLMALMETMSWLQANLNTSLQMLNLSMMIVNQKQIDLAVTNSASSVSNTDQMLNMASRLDQNNTSLEDKLHMLEQQLNKVESNFLYHGARAILKPDLQRSILDGQQNFDKEVGSLVTEAHFQREISRIRCSCPRRTQSTYTIRGASQSATAQNDGCQFHMQNKRIIVLLKRRTFCNWFLSFSVEASLAITKGAGGYSISPRFEFRAVVPVDSPVFSLLLEAQKVLWSQAASVVIESTHRKLLGLFREGKASYSDTLPNGDTILHVITSWQYYSSQWDAYSWLSWRALISGLVRSGLSPNRVNDLGETPADRMIKRFEVFYRRRDLRQQHATVDICSDLLNSGGYMTDMALDWRHRPNCFNPAYHADGIVYFYEDFSIRLIWQLADKNGIQDIDLPEELLPLIHRSEKLLESLLRKGVDLPQLVVDSYTQWPTGLALLLHSGYKPSRYTLRAACEADCEDSVKMLINTQECTLGQDELDVASLHHRSAIVELVVQGLVDRRARLKALAMTHFPGEVCHELGIRSNTFLEFHAYRTYQALKASSINVSNVQEEREWSVYDSIGTNLKLADRLWDAGFRDVDEIDDNGETCLMRLRRGVFQHHTPVDLIGKANWLIGKGADINRKESNSSALHFLAHAVGEAIHAVKSTSEFASELSRMSEDCKGLMRRILFDNIRDSCCCPCSLNGCSGLTRLLNGIFPRRYFRGMDELVPRLTAMMETLFDSQGLAPQEGHIDEIAPDILRFITCRSLDITHTCNHKYGGVKPDDIMGIQNEEKLLIQDLDQVSVKFLSKYKELDLSLPDFLTGYWFTHIDEALSSRGTLSEEDLSRILAIGVVLDGYGKIEHC